MIVNKLTSITSILNEETFDTKLDFLAKVSLKNNEHIFSILLSLARKLCYEIESIQDKNIKKNYKNYLNIIASNVARLLKNAKNVLIVLHESSLIKSDITTSLLQLVFISIINVEQHLVQIHSHILILIAISEMIRRELINYETMISNLTYQACLNKIIIHIMCEHMINFINFSKSSITQDVNINTNDTLSAQAKNVIKQKSLFFINLSSQSKKQTSKLFEALLKFVNYHECQCILCQSKTHENYLRETMRLIRMKKLIEIHNAKIDQYKKDNRASIIAETKTELTQEARKIIKEKIKKKIMISLTSDN